MRGLNDTMRDVENLVEHEIDEAGILMCPVCETSVYVHVDRVSVFTRGEDEVGAGVAMDAVTGSLQLGGSTLVPSGSFVGEGRRHRIALTGSCEECRQTFSIVFTQHKGSTYVELET